MPPNRLLFKDGSFAVFGEGIAKNERGRFCVVPCPSFVYTDDEYRSMWGGYACIGLLALALNFVAVCGLFTSKTYVSLVSIGFLCYRYFTAFFACCHPPFCLTALHVAIVVLRCVLSTYKSSISCYWGLG
jgi:hypothetical protein